MKIKQLRISQSISQKDMALSLGISQSALCMYESGQRKPSIELLPKIARILNCTVDELLQTEPTDQEAKKICCQCKYFCVGTVGEGCECGLGFGEVYHTMMACPSFELD